MNNHLISAPIKATTQNHSPSSNDRTVYVEKQGNQFTLIRNGQPYYIKGIGGSKHLDLACQYGANSLRTWSSGNAETILDKADSYNMTVMLGIGMSKDNDSYLNDAYKAQKHSEVQGLLDKYKNHPALLIWAVGNEINLGTNSMEAWKFVGELAQVIKSHDPNHPVCTVIAGYKPDVLDNIAQYAPAIDITGLNVYAAGLSATRAYCCKSSFKGPYIITEWGPYGHWEVPKTNWNAPIEETSAEKAVSYYKGYRYIYNNNDIFLGSYVFYWDQKEERTPTWYGMFIEENAELGLSGESCPTVDVMKYSWTGLWPENLAPKLTALKVNGLTTKQNVILEKGCNCTGTVEVTDPDGDEMMIIWEFLMEATKLGSGGSYEPRPEKARDAIQGTSKEINFTAPESGKYRLYVYVLDGKGHAATANIPFMVI